MVTSTQPWFPVAPDPTQLMALPGGLRWDSRKTLSKPRGGEEETMLRMVVYYRGGTGGWSLPAGWSCWDVGCGCWSDSGGWGADDRPNPWFSTANRDRCSNSVQGIDSRSNSAVWKRAAAVRSRSAAWTGADRSARWLLAEWARRGDRGGRASSRGSASVEPVYWQQSGSFCSMGLRVGAPHSPLNPSYRHDTRKMNPQKH